MRRGRGRGRVVAGGGNNGGQWWAEGAALHYALFLFFFFRQWRMQKTKEKEKRKRKSNGWRWKRQRPIVSCSPLFTCNVNNEECRRQRGRRRGMGIKQWLEVSWGKGKVLLCSVSVPIVAFYSSFSFLFIVFINTVALNRKCCIAKSMQFLLQQNYIRNAFNGGAHTWKLLSIL